MSPSRLLFPPENYRPATTLERRTTTPDVIQHNRRLGWLLTLAKRHRLVPAPGTDHQARVDLAILLLADLLPPDLASSYVANVDDFPVTLGLLPDDVHLVSAQLPGGTTLDLIAADPGRLDTLGIKPVTKHVTKFDKQIGGVL